MFYGLFGETATRGAPVPATSHRLARAQWTANLRPCYDTAPGKPIALQ